MYALIDCNNFFVSCERTLDKSLIDQPVVVLSNNDGCIVSRSNEAKALGIPMGAPVFKYKELFKQYGVKSFSAKFELYNFRSQQVMNVIKEYAPDFEAYSIDEAFLDLSGFEKYINIYEHSKKLRAEILEASEIPTSIGIAPSKTLAKIANRIVKKFPAQFPDGVYIMDTTEKIEKALKWLDIGDVWGIGRKLTIKMQDAGVYKAYDLLKKPEMWIQKQMGIHGIRMVNEMKGIRQLEIEEPSAKKSIAVTRSFMEMIKDKTELQERVEMFAHTCAEKLRRQNSCCKMITVFVRTNRFRKDLPEYYNGITMPLPNPSSSSIILAKAATQIFEQLFLEGFQYKKAGVIVSDFVPENERITSLFDVDLDQKHLPIMKTMDRLNRKYGKDKIRLASLQQKSTFGRKLLSPEYEAFLKNNTLPEANYRFH